MRSKPCFFGGAKFKRTKIAAKKENQEMDVLFEILIIMPRESFYDKKHGDNRQKKKKNHTETTVVIEAYLYSYTTAVI